MQLISELIQSAGRFVHAFFTLDGTTPVVSWAIVAIIVAALVVGAARLYRRWVLYHTAAEVLRAERAEKAGHR